MNLDEAQKQQVARWIEEGLKLSDIQQRLAAEFGAKLTYMEVRLLMSELQLRPKDTPVPEPVKATELTQPAGPDKAGPAAAQDDAGQDDMGGGLPGNVTLTVDQVTRVGAMVSGKVTFSDGQKAEWYLDQYGRLGLATEKKGYKPSSEDLMAFQSELQNALAGM